MRPIAIVGGGPAGAFAASLLAAGGREVLLFDEKLAWEKPCGGGLTHKALTQYPFLNEAHPESRLIKQCELLSPSGKKVRFKLRHELAIFSRTALNGLMLQRATDAGAEVRKERVLRIAGSAGDWRLTTNAAEYSAEHVILAAGARDPFRSQFTSAIAPEDLMVTSEYFIPGESSLVQIQFLKGISGYIWVFPRPGHCSAGIAAKMGQAPTSDLRRRLEAWLADNHIGRDGAQFYSHILPAFRAETLATLQACGDGWTMIGDNAGLVDPITGEGLYYAFRSAELCSEALLAGRPEEYAVRLKAEILSELLLAARVSNRFYNGQVFGESVVERVVALTQQSASIRELMSDLFAGVQGYADLRPRLYRILPSLMLEGLGSLRRPWGGAGDPLAE